LGGGDMEEKETKGNGEAPFQVKDLMAQIPTWSPPESEYTVLSSVWKKLAGETGIESDLRETPEYVGRWISEKNSCTYKELQVILP